MWENNDRFARKGRIRSIHDRDFDIIKVNRALSDYYSLDPNEVIRKKCHEFFYSGNTSAANCPQKITLNENIPATAEIMDSITRRIFLVSTFPFRLLDAEFHETFMQQRISPKKDKGDTSHHE
jgi:PAS domain-containing protein